MQPSGLAVTVVLVAGLATGCANGPGGGYKQSTGTLLGAAAGGLAGAQIGSGTGNLAAIAAGTLLGAAMGGETGASLDRADAAYTRVPGYRVPPPAGYAPVYTAPTYGAPIYGASAYGTPAYGRSYPGVVAAVPQLPAGCQAVGSGIWCEQANGTFSRAP